MSDAKQQFDSRTSHSLLARLRDSKRDQQAWNKFVDLYGRLVYSWCRKAGVAPEDVSDLGQEVFRRVATSIDAFRHRQAKGSFRAWLKTITYHVTSDHFNHRNRRHRVEGGTEHQLRLNAIPDQIESKGEECEAAESLEILERALKLIEGDFEPHTWIAFWRTAMEGHDTTDVAGDLKMTPRAVRQARYRVMARLRTEFAELLDS